MEKMKANVFYGKNDIRVEEVERPHAGVGEAVIQITLTTICGTALVTTGLGPLTDAEQKAFPAPQNSAPVESP